MKTGSNSTRVQRGLTLFQPCHILTVVSWVHWGKKMMVSCFTVSSPGLFLQGQEGYQTSRFNNASIKFTERNVFYFANVIYFRICSYWQFYYLYLCSKGAVSLQCGKAVLRGICTCASPPPTKAIPPALPPPTPKCTHINIRKHTTTLSTAEKFYNFLRHYHSCIM